HGCVLLRATKGSPRFCFTGLLEPRAPACQFCTVAYDNRSGLVMEQGFYTKQSKIPRPRGGLTASTRSKPENGDRLASSFVSPRRFSPIGCFLRTPRSRVLRRRRRRR